MDMQNRADNLVILAALQEQDRTQTLSDAAVICRFEAAPHIVALGAAPGRQLLAHDLFLGSTSQDYHARPSRCAPKRNKSVPITITSLSSTTEPQRAQSQRTHGSATRKVQEP